MSEKLAKMVATARQSKGKVVRSKEIPFGISWTGSAIKVHPSTDKAHGVALNSLLFTEVLSLEDWPKYAKQLVELNEPVATAASVGSGGKVAARAAAIKELKAEYPEASYTELVEMVKLLED